MDIPRTYRISSKHITNPVEFKARNNTYALLQRNKDNYTIIILSAAELIELYNAITNEMLRPIGGSFSNIDKEVD